YMPMPTMEDPGKSALTARKDRQTRLSDAKEALRARTADEQALDQANQTLALLSAKKQDKATVDAQKKLDATKKQIADSTARITQTQLATEPTATSSTPVNLHILVAETRAGSQLAAKAGAILNAASGDINKATASFINDRLLPSQIEANKAAKTTADQ